MLPIDIKEKRVSTALIQYFFPFAYKEGSEQNMFLFIQNQNFTPYCFNNLENEKTFYGSYHVSHREMEAYFLPFTSNILFPSSENEKGFQRYSKILNIDCLLSTIHFNIPFQIHSVDIIICPFGLGFLTIRSEINETPLSLANEFANCFRMLEPQNEKEKNTEIECVGKSYQSVKSFLFNFLFPGLTDFFDDKADSFFNSRKMYVHSFYALNEGEIIDLVDVYRSGTLSGLNADGKPFINTNNLDYITNYLKDHSYNRLAPNTYYFIDENCFSCISNQNDDINSMLARKLHGEHYYTVLINLFHKLIFLKIANDYSQINIDQDTKEFEKLIYTINSFTSNYYFVVYPAESEGQELFKLLRNSFNTEQLYFNTKEALFSLFKYEENTVTKRDSLLLLLLTVYTVFCGILSINLFTDDLKGNINWSHFMSYNPFEYFAVILVFSGLIVAAILLIQGLNQGIQDRKYRKEWVKRTIPSVFRKKNQP